MQTRVDLSTVAAGSRTAAATYASHLLRPGQSMEVTDGHDPLDVLRDFERRSDRYVWTYLERGPMVWRAAVRRVPEPLKPPTAPAPGTDGASAVRSLAPV